MDDAELRDLPPYQDLAYPVLKGVDEVGGSAQGREITAKVIDDMGFSYDLVGITYVGRAGGHES